MSKILISYFSASGITKNIALNMSKILNADLFEIEPVEKYTNEDLNYMNNDSRTSKEMNDKSYRPSIIKKVNNISDYDTIILGFPVWWYTAPTIINTFIEENDLSNKKIYVFVTSGSSSADGSFNDLKGQYPELNFIKAKRFSGSETIEEYQNWIQ